MPVEKKYFEENYEDSIQFYGTYENEICISFHKNNETNFTIDLDIETIEEFIKDLNLEMQRIKLKIENEGGTNG